MMRMRKCSLLLTTVLSASASLTFAGGYLDGASRYTYGIRPSIIFYDQSGNLISLGSRSNPSMTLNKVGDSANFYVGTAGGRPDPMHRIKRNFNFSDVSGKDSLVVIKSPSCTNDGSWNTKNCKLTITYAKQITDDLVSYILASDSLNDVPSNLWYKLFKVAPPAQYGSIYFDKDQSLSISGMALSDDSIDDNISFTPAYNYKQGSLPNGVYTITFSISTTKHPEGVFSSTGCSFNITDATKSGIISCNAPMTFTPYKYGAYMNITPVLTDSTGKSEPLTPETYHVNIGSIFISVLDQNSSVGGQSMIIGKNIASDTSNVGDKFDFDKSYLPIPDEVLKANNNSSIYSMVYDGVSNLLDVAAGNVIYDYQVPQNGDAMTQDKAAMIKELPISDQIYGLAIGVQGTKPGRAAEASMTFTDSDTQKVYYKQSYSSTGDFVSVPSGVDQPLSTAYTNTDSILDLGAYYGAASGQMIHAYMDKGSLKADVIGSAPLDQTAFPLVVGNEKLVSYTGQIGSNYQLYFYKGTSQYQKVTLTNGPVNGKEYTVDQSIVINKQDLQKPILYIATQDDNNASSIYACNLDLSSSAPTGQCEKFTNVGGSDANKDSSGIMGVDVFDNKLYVAYSDLGLQVCSVDTNLNIS